MKTVVKAKRRFTERSKKHKPMTLGADHKAIVNGVTLFPTTVRTPDHDSKLFKPGANNVKIGSHVAKGKLWAGKPEVWRVVPGFAPYEVSSWGRIRREGRLLKLTLSNTYFYVDFCIDGKRTKTGVHVAVALAFVGPKPSAKHQVAHEDGDSEYNSPDNLSWKTVKGNSEDRSRHGRAPQGERHGCAKLSAKEARQIRKQYVYYSRTNGTSALARRFGISQNQIWSVVKGRAWRHI